MDGYLYYLPDLKESTAGMPTANELRTYGQRIAISEGENVVTLEGVPEAQSVVYLYEMSYAQRFSNGIQVEVPEYNGEIKPPDPETSEKGDVNGDGTVDLVDVIRLLDAVTEGKLPAAETVDLNGDGKVDLIDVISLLDLVTRGE